MLPNSMSVHQLRSERWHLQDNKHFLPNNQDRQSNAWPVIAQDLTRLVPGPRAVHIAKKCQKHTRPPEVFVFCQVQQIIQL